VYESAVQHDVKNALFTFILHPWGRWSRNMHL